MATGHLIIEISKGIRTSDIEGVHLEATEL
jgi:hypothetical protein